MYSEGQDVLPVLDHLLMDVGNLNDKVACSEQFVSASNSLLGVA